MFEAEAYQPYPSGEAFRCTTLWWAPGLTRKHKIRPETPDRDEHSSSLRTLVNYGRLKTYLQILERPHFCEKQTL
jgi:hypothetical protein